MKNLLHISALAVVSAVAAVALAAAPDGNGPWADAFSNLTQGTLKNGGAVAVDRSDGTDALGVSESTGTPYDAAVAGSFLSLGFGGTVTVSFDNTIENGAGADVRIYEVTGGSSYPDETATVEASHNGTDWVTLAPGAVRDEDLDLGDILSCAKYIRVTDTSNVALFEATADAYDLDGVLALNSSTDECDLSASIEVVKTASSYEVFPGENVDYTYTVTNDGDFDLDNIQISDDKCAPLSGPTGDVGDIGVLSVGEVWEYTCSMTLDETTINVVDVTADDPWNHEVDDSDEVEVAVKDPGCTLTQGYWKTHSPEGPAQPNDPTWESLYDDMFAGTSMTWLTTLWTPPKKGDVWFSLAHQYIAAYLNILGGADDTDVADEMVDAWTKLTSVAPGAVPKAEKNAWTMLAGVLGSYNEGLIGPGHCSETNDEI